MLAETKNLFDFAISGEVYALLTALSWAIAVLLFKKCGQEIPPAALNLFKGVVGFVFLVLTFFLVNESFWPGASLKDCAILMFSGALGIGIADTFFLMSLNRLGASRTAIVDCLYSPFVILFSWLVLGEILTAYDGIGAGLIVIAVLILFKKDSQAQLSRKDFFQGVIFGLLSMILMAIGIVIAKPLLNLYPVLWSTTVRMVGGILCIILFASFSPARKTMWKAFRPGASWKLLIPTCFIGSYLCLLFWISGMKYTQTNIASMLNQTSSVLIVILAAVFLKERLSVQKIIAISLAFAGSVLIFLR